MTDHPNDYGYYTSCPAARIFEWPRQIADREYLFTLNGTVFQRISELYTNLHDKLRSNKIEDIDNVIDEALKKIYQKKLMDYFINPFVDFGFYEDLKKGRSTGLIHVEPENIELIDGTKKWLVSD